MQDQTPKLQVRTNDEELRISLLTAIQHKDRKALHMWIKIALGISIPYKSICPDHDAPFDFVADYLFENFINALVLANRSGGKTEDFAVLDTILTWLYPNIEVATVGAILEQAKKCYSYFQTFSTRFPFHFNIAQSTMNKTDCGNGSNLQVLPGTMAAVNSPHPSFTFLDEIDLMQPNVLSQAIAMGQSKNGIQARTVLTSTRKFAGGIMQRMLDNADNAGYKTYKWCIWEVMEGLPDPKSELYGRIMQLFGATLPDRIGQADGYYTWIDVIQKYLFYRENDIDVWDAEYLCLKPGIAGVIYGGSYSDDNNMISSNWSPRGKTGYLYLFEDFGSVEDHPDVVLPVWVPHKFDRMIVFNELYMTHMGTDQILEAIENMLLEDGLSMSDVVGWIPDYHGIVQIADREQKGYPMYPKEGKPEDYLINNYIKLVQKWFSSGKLMLTPRCVQLRVELLSYKRKKNPDGSWSNIAEKKFDHGPSCLGYGCIYLNPLLGSNAHATMNEVREIEERLKDHRPGAYRAVRENRTTRDDRPLTAGLMKEKL